MNQLKNVTFKKNMLSHYVFQVMEIKDPKEFVFVVFKTCSDVINFKSTLNSRIN